MSSFRPAIAREAPCFVPLRLGRAGGDDSVFGFESGVEGASAGGAPGSASIVANPESTPAAAGIDPEEVEAREAEAYARGLAEGRAEAASIDATWQTLERAAERLEATGTAALAANREGLLALAAAIARRWVGQELECSPEAFVGVLDAAIARLPEDERLKIRLSPADAERVAAAFEQAAPESMPSWQIEPDAAIGPGEFLLEGEATLIDGRAKAVLADLTSHLATAVDAPTPSAPDAPLATADEDGPAVEGDPS